MPLALALAVRGTVAGHRLGALEEKGGPPPPLPMHPWVMGRDAQQLQTLVSPTSAVFGTIKSSGLLCRPSETNDGPARHTAGTAIKTRGLGGGGWVVAYQDRARLPPPVWSAEWS